MINARILVGGRELVFSEAFTFTDDQSIEILIPTNHPKRPELRIEFAFENAIAPEIGMSIDNLSYGLRLTLSGYLSSGSSLGSLNPLPINLGNERYLLYFFMNHLGANQMRDRTTMSMQISLFRGGL